jgi:hypothetical protein
MRARILLVGSFVVLVGCGSHGGSSGFAMGSTVGASTSSSTGGVTSGSATTPSGWVGTWAVTGTDPLRGAFQGTAVVTPANPGYTVQKLVTFSTKLPSGDQLAWAWNATAQDDPAGLRVTASLKRADVFRTAGSITRTAADQTPLAETALLASSGGTIAGTYSTSLGAGPTESWTRTQAPAPAFPVTQVALLPGHAAPTASLKTLLFTVFSTYHVLPAIQPYVSRPEFQAAVHQVTLDRSSFDFYRQIGPGTIVIVDKVNDDVAVEEERRRAGAFSHRLHEKGALFDADMTNVCADQNGMVTAVDQTVSPPKKDYAQSPVLYTGLWTLSQRYRYEATGSQEAFDNVVRGATGAAICVDISPDKTQFARAIDFLANAQPGQVGPPGGKYAWVAGTGTYANLMWMFGGNNDMLHGIDCALESAASILPKGHPLLAQVGAQAESLVNNVKIAQSGDHEIILTRAAWLATGDPAWQQKYQTALGFKNVLQKLYLTAGLNLFQWQGIADWSGHGLGGITMLELSLLGGTSPTSLEQSWRDAVTKGSVSGFGMAGPFRGGFTATVGANANAPGANDTLVSVLEEFPYPKQTTATPDFTVSTDFCLSPYPSDPWYFDWTTNSGRIQGLRAYPLFYRGGEQSYWNRSPLVMGGSPGTELLPAPDFLVSYWFARRAGIVGPND